MIGNRRVLAVIPARGGSKGIPLKNLQPVGGVPMVVLAGQVAHAVPEIDRTVVSTDHPEIVATVQAAGIDVPFVRPEPISGDRIGDWDVLTHALAATEADDDQTYDIVMMLQPTCPLRTAAHVRDCLHKLVDGRFDAVWTVSPSDTKDHPLKQLNVNKNDVLDYYDPAGSKVIARQQLQPLYHRNGAAYAITRQCLMDHGNIKGARTGALVLHERLISIDTPWDLQLTEFILQNRQQEPALCP